MTSGIKWYDIIIIGNVKNSSDNIYETKYMVVTATLNILKNWENMELMLSQQYTDCCHIVEESIKIH